MTDNPSSLPDERETRRHDPRRLIVFGVGAAIGGLSPLVAALLRYAAR